LHPFRTQSVTTMWHSISSFYLQTPEAQIRRTFALSHELHRRTRNISASKKSHGSAKHIYISPMQSYMNMSRHGDSDPNANARSSLYFMSKTDADTSPWKSRDCFSPAVRGCGCSVSCLCQQGWFLQLRANMYTPF